LEFVHGKNPLDALLYVLREKRLEEINEVNFSGFISQPLAVIAFSSPWCASCKMIVSSLHTLSRELEGQVSFGTCDISAYPAIASSLQIFSLPAVIVFKNGVEAKKLVGPVTEAAMLRTLKELL
jgi:thioredoxin 1